MFHEIDRDLVSKLRQHIKKDETVVFLPWGNDFIANYLAPRTGFFTFNIGGDKNLLEAQKNWPQDMIAVRGEIDTDKIPTILKMLLERTTDVVVFPYFDMLWASHHWPCHLGTDCLTKQKEKLSGVIDAVKNSPYFSVDDSNLFTLIRLSSEYAEDSTRKAVLDTLFDKICYPIVFNSVHKESSLLLRKGWHGLETNHVWSKADSKVTLPIPKDCETKNCNALIKFNVFGASKNRPVSIKFSSIELSGSWNKTIVANSFGTHKVSVPLNNELLTQEISISVPNATSPYKLSGSRDWRTLGIMLKRIDLVSK
ncbi:hypothetical protein DSCA_09830 [Desulfosarcina alkanivorans]|uniref:Uncharacterized protein n=2 Tax=Desulfosarcina alkanivorans TaxID=571177 RepID=A0A5K7YEH2_9BACT|nr:hypothetical protein DSCA_09830 [Desulfosarcina alkanivorans]